MKKRGERFGITPPCLTKVANALIDHTRPPSFPATTIQVEEEDRKRKRMERFGMTVTELSSEASVCSNNVWSTIIYTRSGLAPVKFHLLLSAQARKKLRAERFGL